MVDAAERQIELLVNRRGSFVVALPVDGVYRSQALLEVVLDLAELWGEVAKDLPRRRPDPT